MDTECQLSGLLGRRSSRVCVVAAYAAAATCPPLERQGRIALGAVAAWLRGDRRDAWALCDDLAAGAVYDQAARAALGAVDAMQAADGASHAPDSDAANLWRATAIAAAVGAVKAAATKAALAACPVGAPPDLTCDAARAASQAVWDRAIAAVLASEPVGTP